VGDEASAPAASTSRAEGAGPVRNLVLITVDTLRADALGFMGNRSVQTPALDRLAAAGRVFSRAHAHNVVTLPSHTNILTGLYPFQHGVRNNGGFALGDDVPTLATVLSEEGFATGAVVGAFPLDSRFGLDRGFGLYDDDLGEGGQLFSYAQRPGTEVVEHGSRWWREHAGERRFLWMHLFDPHAPYEPPKAYAERAANPYLGEVAAVDGALKPFLESFLGGREEPTLIVFTADHGEALGEHGERTHGFFAYEPTLAVPFVLWGPGIEPGRDERPARHVDILPTALDLLGVDAPSGIAGRSLVQPPAGSPGRSPGKSDTESSEAVDTYFESMSPNLEYGAAPLRGVIRDGVKLIDVPVPELYDLKSDPDELDNVIDTRRQEARALYRALPEASAALPEAGEVSAEELERLRSLGYVGSSAARKESYGVEDDPKTLAALVGKLDDMTKAYSAGGARQVDRAVELGWALIDERPSLTVAYEYLAKILLQENRLTEALRLLGRAEEEGASNDALRQQLGLTLVQAGRPGEAVEVLRRIDPEAADAETLSSLGLALASMGRMAEARQALERAVEIDPDSARSFEILSFVALQTGDANAARRYARQALELDAYRPDSWNNLAIAEYQAGNAAQAVEAWKRAATLDPRNLDVLYNLGVVAGEVGDATTARRALERFLAAAPPSGYEAEVARARQTLAGLGS